MLPTKPWLPSFGPLPAALAGRIPVEPAFSERIRRAANRFYIDEMAAIAAEPDPDVAKERARRLDETLNDAVARGRLAELSPSAGRLMRAMEKMNPDAKASEVDPGMAGEQRPRKTKQPPGCLASRLAGGRTPAGEVHGDYSHASPTLSTRRDSSEGASASPKRGAGTHHARPTKGGDHEDLAASGLPLSTPVGTLLQLRPGQDVAVFGDVAWDGRRA